MIALVNKIITIWKYRIGWLWDLLLLIFSSKNRFFSPHFKSKTIVVSVNDNIHLKILFLFPSTVMAFSNLTAWKKINSLMQKFSLTAKNKYLVKKFKKQKLYLHHTNTTVKRKNSFYIYKICGNIWWNYSKNEQHKLKTIICCPVTAIT